MYTTEYLGNPKTIKCNAYSEENKCSGYGHFKCDGKCGISKNYNKFCFKSTANCFLLFHLKLENQKDKHLPKRIGLSERRMCVNGCGNQATAKCSKCEQFFCLNELRNCFYARKH